MTVSMKQFAHTFCDNLEFIKNLSEHNLDYYQALDFGNAFDKAHKEFVGDLCAYLKDNLDMDDAMVAFAFTLSDFEIIKFPPFNLSWE